MMLSYAVRLEPDDNDTLLVTCPDLPGVVTYDSPFRRTLNPTNIRDMRDDIVDGSFGFKIAPARNTIIVLNALFPLNRGGLRPNLAYTFGLERTF